MTPSPEGEDGAFDDEGSSSVERRQGLVQPGIEAGRQETDDDIALAEVQVVRHNARAGCQVAMIQHDSLRETDGFGCVGDEGQIIPDHSGRSRVHKDAIAAMVNIQDAAYIDHRGGRPLQSG